MAALGPRPVALGLAVVLGALIPACSDSGDGGEPRTLTVPDAYDTIQAAVDDARPGDLVLISPGTYEESVTVETAQIVIRGLDRNEVVLDGGDTLPNGFLVQADGVAVENLTLHGYTQNGIIFNGAYEESGGLDPTVVYGTADAALSGFRASYVTAYNNGLYGLYAFAARDGQFDNSYVSGHPDSGIYVGQCKPCNTLVTDVVAERNAIGYYGTNGSGGIFVVNSIFRGNRLGMTPNSQDMERLTPQEETVIAGNLVIDNDDPDAPPIARGFFGGGIAVGGGTRNVVVRNRVLDHDGGGILVITLGRFQPMDNRIEGNVLENNGVDLVYDPMGTDEPLGNCFAGNTFTTSQPDDIETVMPCDADPPGPLTLGPYEGVIAPPAIDYRDLPAPAPQPTMPDAATAPAEPAVGLGGPVDLAAIELPEAP